MADNYKLLTRLFVGILKHQAKKLLGDDAIAVLAEAGSEHLGEKLMETLKGEASSREQAKRLSIALQLAADELERELGGRVSFQIEDAPDEIVEAVVEALASLESGDLLGRRLQSAIQDLVAVTVMAGAEISMRVAMQLYQAVLMAVLVIPELQVRAQDLLQQSRMWLLGEQIRRIEAFSPRPLRAKASVKALGLAPKSRRKNALRQVSPSDSSAENSSNEGESMAGQLVANGRVRLERLLGQGGHGSVWEGYDVTNHARVAVKFLHQSWNDDRVVASFQRETTYLHSLGGSAVPRLLYPPMFENGRHFYVTELLENSESMDRTLQGVQHSVAQKLQVLIEVASVVHDIHQKGVIHGDLKPQNILLQGPERSVRLIDWGSAREIGPRDLDEPISFTYTYAAPEMISLPTQNPSNAATTSAALALIRNVGPSLDIYSLGIMLFEALDPGLARMARMEEYGLIDRLVIGTEFKAILRKAIAREPGGRFHTALEFGDALNEALIAATSSNDDG